MNPRLISAFVRTAALVVIAVALNVFVGRHYTRWDVTESRRYSLSSATKETLHALPETVHVWVLMSARDPLAQSVKQTLVAYLAETNRLDVKYIDPERDTIAFEDARKRFRIEAARASEGQVVTDAVMVVFMGERHRYVSVDDLVDVSEAKDAQVKPREEQAITLAIRHVLRGEKTRLCFTRGHGEPSLDEGSDRGLGLFRDILEKDNYETKTVDLLAPGRESSLEGCDVALVVGPRDAFSPTEDEALFAHVGKGHGVLVAASPLFAPTESGTAKLGLERTLSAFGVVAVDALVVEKEAASMLAGDGIFFLAQAAPHAITAGLVAQDPKMPAPRMPVQFARPLRRATVDVSPVEIVRTTEAGYGITSVRGAAEWTAPPPKGEKDLPGPLTIGMATELPKVRADMPHGARGVVLGSASFFYAQQFREPLGNRGAALLAESAISWLGAKPPILDIPSKASIPAGIRITEESRTQVRNYVLFLMPGGVVLLALALFFSRRGREGATHGPSRRP